MTTVLPLRALRLPALVVLLLAGLLALPPVTDRLMPRESFADYAARTLPQVLPEALAKADAAAAARIDAALDPVFAPVDAAIPAYADFHYSLLGQYTELAATLSDDIARGLEDRLFGGFDDRLSAAATGLDATWHHAFRAALTQALAADAPAHLAALPVEATALVLDDTTSRLGVTAPLSAAGAIAGRAGARLAARAIARTLAAQAIKLAAAAPARGTTLSAGAGTGAALGSFAGPVGTVVGGIAGGLAAWVGTDYALLKLDERLNRDDFEAELAALVDQRRAETAAALAAALAQRSHEVGATIRQQRAAAPAG